MWNFNQSVYQRESAILTTLESSISWHDVSLQLAVFAV